MYELVGLWLDCTGDISAVRAAGPIACDRERGGGGQGRGDRAAGVGLAEGLGLIMRSRCWSCVAGGVCGDGQACGLVGSSVPKARFAADTFIGGARGVTGGGADMPGLDAGRAISSSKIGTDKETESRFWGLAPARSTCAEPGAAYGSFDRFGGAGGAAPPS